MKKVRYANTQLECQVISTIEKDVQKFQGGSVVYYL